MKLTYCTSLLILVLTANITFANESGHSHKHHHGQFDVSSSLNKPELSLEVIKDSSAGWNIHIKVKNFRFTPENIDKAPLASEGHAHLYVDGKKLLVYIVLGFT